MQAHLTAPLAVGSRASAGKTAFHGAKLPVTASKGNPRLSRAVITNSVASQSEGTDKWNTTYYPTGMDAANVYKKWVIIDAEGQTLGRLASLAANYIRGKNCVTYTPSMDMGAYVIVINAEKVDVTGNKELGKLYYRHTVGRPGSMKIETFRELRARIPERIIERAVKGMLPKGKLGNNLFRHLKVFKGAKHPHEAQQPADVTKEINKRPSELVSA